MTRPFDLVMFDLDGTLIDSLPAIAAAANAALAGLAGLDRPPLPVDRFRQLAGQGLPSLVHGVLGDAAADHFDDFVAAHRHHYQTHAPTLLRVFPGIHDLLQNLAGAPLPTAVLSNKPHADTQADVARLFPDHCFAAVIGHRDGHPVKPDPASALEIATTLNVAPARVLYVGDTAADMQTAVNAGFYPLGVTWGFRSADELLQHGAQCLAHSADEVFSAATRNH